LVKYYFMSFLRYHQYWEGELEVTPITKVLQGRELEKHKFGPLTLKPNLDVPVEYNNYGGYDILFNTTGGRPNYNCCLTKIRSYNLRSMLACDTLLYTLK
jgi:hypothetical protein